MSRRAQAHPRSHAAGLADLLRAELEACETYRRFLRRIGTSRVATELRQVLEHHREAAAKLDRAAVAAGGDLRPGGGRPWGLWTRFVENAREPPEPASALRVLRQGESLGAKLYEKTLDDPGLDEDTRTYVRFTLLPGQHAHIRLLNALIDDA